MDVANQHQVESRNQCELAAELELAEVARRLDDLSEHYSFIVIPNEDREHRVNDYAVADALRNHALECPSLVSRVRLPDGTEVVTIDYSERVMGVFID